MTMGALLLVTVLTALWCVDGFPDGPPLSACLSAKPGTQVGTTGLEGHTLMAQNYMPGPERRSPFYIQVHLTDAHYTPGQDIKVSIVANQTLSSNCYRGILMTARKLQCASNHTVRVEEDILGMWTVPFPSSTTLLTTMNCIEKTRSAVSHKTRQLKINETVTWSPPDAYTGHAVFWATIVQEDTVYWTEISSRVLEDPNAGPIPTCAAPTLVPSFLTMMAFFILFITRH